MVTDVVTAYVDGATAEGYVEDWDLEQLWTALKTLYPVSIDHRDVGDGGRRGIRRPDPRRAARRAARGRARAYAVREKQLEEIAGEGAMRQLERNVMLNVLDRKWREHLYEMDYLKEGINLRAVAQQDPVVEYQREGYDMFTGMLDAMKEESVGFLFNVTSRRCPRPRPRRWHPSPRPRARPISAPTPAPRRRPQERRRHEGASGPIGPARQGN